MRYAIIFLFISFVTIFAQTDSTAVDSATVSLSELVQQQILLAQAKQEAEKIMKQEAVTATVETRQPQVIKRIRIATTDYSFIWKISVLVVGSSMIFGFVFYRRKKLSVAQLKQQDMKKKLTFLREEKVIPKQNPYLKQVRSNLLATAGQGELSEDAITNAARKLRISREEIMLANRIRSHQMMHV